MPYIGAGTQRFNTADGLTVSGNASVSGTTALTGNATAAGTLDVTGAITSSAGATITTADNNPQLTLTSTDTDSGHGPRLNMVRNPSEAGADGDNLGQIFIQGYNDAGTPELIDYFQLFTPIADASDGTEDARQIHYVMTGGSQRSRIEHNATEKKLTKTAKISTSVSKATATQTCCLLMVGMTKLVSGRIRLTALALAVLPALLLMSQAQRPAHHLE